MQISVVYLLRFSRYNRQRQIDCQRSESNRVPNACSQNEEIFNIAQITERREWRYLFSVLLQAYCVMFIEENATQNYCELF